MMMRISDIDPNFRLSSDVPADMKFHSVWEPHETKPFRETSGRNAQLCVVFTAV